MFSYKFQFFMTSRENQELKDLNTVLYFGGSDFFSAVKCLGHVYGIPIEDCKLSCAYLNVMSR